MEGANANVPPANAFANATQDDDDDVMKLEPNLVDTQQNSAVVVNPDDDRAPLARNSPLLTRSREARPSSPSLSVCLGVDYIPPAERPIYLELAQKQFVDTGFVIPDSSDDDNDNDDGDDDDNEENI